MKKILILFTALLLAGTACKKTEEQAPLTSTDNIVYKNMLIFNESALLDSRMTLSDEPSEYIVGNTSKRTSKSSDAVTGSSATIELIARLSPPEYGDEILQASHVKIFGHYAYVAYNTQGERYLGAVDVVDVAIPSEPKLISSVIFINQETNKGKDVSSLDVTSSSSGNTLLYITGSDETSDSAFVERFELNSSNQFESDQTKNASLRGWVGTDVRYFNDKVYVTSGTGGGLTVLDAHLNELSFVSVENARSVDANNEYEIALGGNPGHLYNPGNWDKEIGGATDPDAKSILRLHNNFALASLGEAGLKCYDMSSVDPSNVISSLPRPVVPEGGEALEYVTNGVSVTENGWVYIANGAAGMDVAKIGTDGQLTWMGNVNLGSSVNFVEANEEYVFVARGVHGLKICIVTEN